VEKLVTIHRYDCDAKTAEEAKRQLVLANRILANEGALDGLGHVSIRNPENPNTFFQSYSIAPEFVTMDGIMEIDMDGKVVSGIEGKKAYGERILHARVMAARPDINCVFHGHPLPLIPFSVCTEIPLLPVMNYGSIFYNGFAHYNCTDPSNGMVVFTAEEADLVAESLGDKWACLMRGHGATIGAENIPQLVLDTLLLIKNAEVQLECLKIGGKPQICTEEEGRSYRFVMHADLALGRCWNYYVSRVKKAMSDVADL